MPSSSPTKSTIKKWTDEERHLIVAYHATQLTLTQADVKKIQDLMPDRDYQQIKDQHRRVVLPAILSLFKSSGSASSSPNVTPSKKRSRKASDAEDTSSYCKLED